MVYNFPETPSIGRVSMQALSAYLRECGVEATPTEQAILLKAWQEALDETIIEVIASKRRTY